MIAIHRVRAALLVDLRLQWRHGFWLVYAFVCVAYVLVLGLFDPRWRSLLTMLVLFADPAVLGFFFIGGSMLLERGDGTLPGSLAARGESPRVASRRDFRRGVGAETKLYRAYYEFRRHRPRRKDQARRREDFHHGLLPSPLRIDEWMLAKVASLTLLAVLASFAVAVPLEPSLRPAWLLAAIIPTSSCFVVIGVVAGTRFSTVNRYLLGGGLATTPLLLPLLAPLGLLDSAIFDLLPTGAALDLLAVSLGRATPSWGLCARALGVLLIWTALVWAWARAWMRRYVIGPEGA